MVNTSEQIKRIGGEIKRTTGVPVLRNNQPNLKAPSLGSDFTSLDISSSILGISNARYDAIVSFFMRKGVSESLARTYGVALLEAAVTTGRDITDLINLNNSDPVVFNDETLTHINFFRNKTSQIGYNVGVNNQEHTIIKRTIFP